MTYARSVRPTIVAPGALPDPSLVFDAVMKRTEYRKHPNNVSSILWYWATIIIHGELRDIPIHSLSLSLSNLPYRPLLDRLSRHEQIQDVIVLGSVAAVRQ